MPNPYPRTFLSAPAAMLCAHFLTGCLYTTQHFNNGRLLDPGSRSLSLGAGRNRTLAYGCPDAAGFGFVDKVKDSTGIHCLAWRYSPDDPEMRGDTSLPVPSWSAAWKASLDYRLGVGGPFGFFSGAEIGLHLEAPTNPATAEFDLKLGLPAPADRPYHHSLSLGLGIGAWADNSFFGEYAISRSFAFGDLFLNYRATYLATQIADLKDAEDKRRFDSHRRLIHQASLGFTWTLPALPAVPDYIAPIVTLTYPLAPAGEDDLPPDYLLDDRDWAFGLGMGWNFR